MRIAESGMQDAENFQTVLAEQPGGILHTIRPRSVTLCAVYLLCIFPIFFGGTTVAALAFTSAAVSTITLFRCLSPTAQRFSRSIDLRTTSLLCLLALCGYLFGQQLLLLKQEFWSTVLSPVFTLPLTFTLLFYLFATRSRKVAAGDNFISTVGTLSGATIASIALAHWLSDNGKLFWIFEPHSVFTSPRARWPFVNANNLGQFLLIPIFLTFHFLLRNWEHFQRALKNRGFHSLAQLPRIAESQTAQRIALQLLLISLALTIEILALLGSLSRGSWIGFLLGALLCLPVYWKGKDEEATSSRARQKSRRKKKGGKKRNGATVAGYRKHLVRLLPLVLLAGVILALLNQRGVEQVAARVEYGVTHSKEDARFQMYRDSLPFFSENPLFGIGAGEWRWKYPQIMDQQLAGYTPKYLHSDPLQALIELGVIGTLPILVLVLLLLRSLLQVQIYASENALLLFLSAGLVAFLTSSFVDFPFQIPGTLFAFAIYLGELVNYLSSRH